MFCDTIIQLDIFVFINPFSQVPDCRGSSNLFICTPLQFIDRRAL